MRQIYGCAIAQEVQVQPPPIHMGFVMDKVVLSQVFPKVLQFSPVSIMPPIFHTRSFIYH